MKTTWTEEMSVSDVTIDAQHKKLLKLVSVISGAINDTSTDHKELIEGTVDALNEYAYQHLDYEERYMVAHKFPGYEKHKIMHDSFRKTYSSFREKLDHEDKTLGIHELSKFLNSWWVNHILNADQEYEAYINEHEGSHPDIEPKNYHEENQQPNL